VVSAAVSSDLPSAPHTVDDLGLPRGLVHDLVLRRALTDGRTSTLRLSETLGCSPVVASELIEELRDLRYLEVQGLQGRDYQVVLSDLGRQTARERLEMSRYVGPLPVSLAAYRETVTRQHAEPRVDPPTMERAFSDLVVSRALIDQLGPASCSAGALFLYGPPGTGKSSIAERLIRIHEDHVLVPHAVEVDSQLITVYDPVVHKAVDPQPSGLDRRWVLCERPSIITGGELTGSMLDLTYQPSSGVYLAPLQMQANNGILVIDDFGRQSISPEALLNRWIVPLDRGIDYLTLDYGLKFEIPFDAKVVFSTNLDPASLGDEAFFRRIENKVLIPAIGPAQFDEVLRRTAQRYGVILVEESGPYLREVSQTLGDGDLRPYLPRSVCRLLVAISGYEGTPPVLDRQAIDRIAALYFTNASKQVELDGDADFAVDSPPEQPDQEDVDAEVLPWPGEHRGAGATIPSADSGSGFVGGPGVTDPTSALVAF
jgi:hypothetical protein